MLILIKKVKKNYRYCVGFIGDDYRIKSLRLIIPKTMSYLKGCDGETKQTFFFYWR